jgi:tetratricopeptide (TPR) repeat protein
VLSTRAHVAVVELTREVIALKFELASAISVASHNAKVGRRSRKKEKEQEEGTQEDRGGEPVFEEPTLPTDVMTFDTFRQCVAERNEEVVRAVLAPQCRRAASTYKQQMGVALVDSCGSHGAATLRGEDGMQMAQLLLSAGAAVSAREESSGRTALHAAAAAGNNQLVQTLVQQEGVDKDALDSHQRTALHLAARSKQARVVQTLLQLGADGDLLSDAGKTARDLAVDPMIGTGDAQLMARVFDSAETKFWNHSARAVAMHRADALDSAMEQYTLAIDLAAQLAHSLSTDDRARLYLNRARVAQRLSNHTQTMLDCEAALGLHAPSSHKKAQAVRAESAMALLDFEKAVDDLKAVVDAGGEHAERWADMLREAKTLNSMTHYEMLNVPSHASATDIKKAFRRESITWHPDKHAGSDDAQYRATLKFKQLNEAHQVLSDPAKRLAYDRKVRYGVFRTTDDEYGASSRGGECAWQLWQTQSPPPPPPPPAAAAPQLPPIPPLRPSSLQPPTVGRLADVGYGHCVCLRRLQRRRAAQGVAWRGHRATA